MCAVLHQNTSSENYTNFEWFRKKTRENSLIAEKYVFTFSMPFFIWCFGQNQIKLFESPFPWMNEPGKPNPFPRLSLFLCLGNSIEQMADSSDDDIYYEQI